MNLEELKKDIGKKSAELIKVNSKIGYFNIGSENNGMYGLGIPMDLQNFINNPISRCF